MNILKNLNLEVQNWLINCPFFFIYFGKKKKIFFVGISDAIIVYITLPEVVGGISSPFQMCVCFLFLLFIFFFVEKKRGAGNECLGI